MAVTSQIRATVSLGEVWIGDWRPAGLLKPSVVKPVFATIEQRLIMRQLGQLVPNDMTAVRRAMDEILG